MDLKTDTPVKALLRLLHKCLPYVMLVAFMLATGFAVWGVQDTKQENIRLESELEAGQQDLQAALAETERLLQQINAANADMKTLLDKAKQEEGAVSDKIEELESAYDLAEERKNQVWLHPMKGAVCSSPYGYREHPVEGGQKFHSGVDLVRPSGTPIIATRSGTVTIATYSEINGYHVKLDHMDGYESCYLHMSNFNVKQGQFVFAGQVIGYCGQSGATTGVHLHFGIFNNGETVNPADYIDI